MAKKPKNDSDDPLHFDELAKALAEPEEKEAATASKGEEACDSSEPKTGEELEAPAEEPGSSPPDDS